MEERQRGRKEWKNDRREEGEERQRKGALFFIIGVFLFGGKDG